MATSDEEEDKKQPGVKETFSQPTPWIQERSSTSARVIGWRNGNAITSSDLGDILRNDKAARKEYKALRQTGRENRGGRPKPDPLTGLPANWQAFWSGVPHLDVRAQYKNYNKEKEKEKEKAAAKAAQLAEDPNDHDTEDEGIVEDEVDNDQKEKTLKEELQQLNAQLKKLSEEKIAAMKPCTEVEKRLRKIRTLDREEEEASKKLKRELQELQCDKGTALGKIRSSDLSFEYMYKDKQEFISREKLTLSRSCCLMDSTISIEKAAVREMLDVAAEGKAPSESNRSM